MTHIPEDPPPFFSLIEFNLTGLCNRTCVFCPRSNPKLFPNINEHLSLELYEKIIKDLQVIHFDGTILYSAFSEPLLHKKVELLIETSKKYCPNVRIEIVCNGDFVTHEKLKKLFNAGLTVLCISMYDGPHQLEKFNAMKKEVGLSDQQMILRVRYLSKEENYGLVLSNRAGMLEMLDVGVVSLKEPLKKACYYPFYQIMVDYDGSVLLCPHDWGEQLIVGNLNTQSLLEVWNSPTMEKVRTALAVKDRSHPPCNVCDVNGTLMGQSHFLRWMEYYERQRPIAR